MDSPLRTNRLGCARLALRGVCDAASLRPNEAGERVRCWVEGLPGDAAAADVRVWIGEQRLRVEGIGEADASGVRQIDAAMPPACAAGEFWVECGGACTERVWVERATPGTTL